MSIKITGTGSALPGLSKSNEDLSKVLDTSHEWIFSRTGIVSRHICEEGLTPIATQAGKNALQDAGVNAEDIDYILCATISGDYGTPSLACLVQKELGATCPAMDISGSLCRIHLWSGSSGCVYFCRKSETYSAYCG